MTSIAETQLQAGLMQRQNSGLSTAKAKLAEAVTAPAQEQNGDIPAGIDMKKVEEAAKDFEAMFLTEMLRPMFEDIKPDPMFGGGKGEEVFQGLMLEEYGKVMVEAGGVGLAEHVKTEMIRIQSEMDKQNR